MPVNYGILKPAVLDAPSISGGGASAPSLREAPDPLQELTSGFLSGYKQGQEIQSNKLQIERQTEALTQDKIRTKDLQQAAADQMELRAAKSADAYYNVLVSQGNQPLAIDFKTKLASQQKDEAMAKVADQEQYKSLVQAKSNFWGLVSQGSTDPRTGQIDPGKAAATFASQYKDLPDSVKKTIDPVFSMNNMMTGLVNVQFAQAQLLRDHKPDITSLEKAQAGRDRAQQELERAKASGDQNLITAAQQKVNEANSFVQKESTPAKLVNNPLDDALAKQDAVAAKTAADARDTLASFRDSIQTAQSQVAKVPEYATGPAANFFKIPKFNKAAQILTSSLNAAALQAKEIYKLGSGQGFTDADRQFLTEIVGNTALNKYSLKVILERMDEISKKAAVQAWDRENNIRRGSATYDSWLKDNPKPDFKTGSQSTVNPPAVGPSKEEIAAEMKRRGLL